MDRLTSLFPLPWVLFPGERLNLHIFEERYRQLISGALETGESFGVPVFPDGQSSGWGCLAALAEVRKTFPDGRMDVVVQGIRPFELLSFQKQFPGKLFPGGRIRTWVSGVETDPALEEEVECLMNKFFFQIGSRPRFDLYEDQPFSFRVAHKLGLDTGAEIRLLITPEETDRLQQLHAHLCEAIEGLDRATRAGARIRQNGHFRSFDALNF
jgi:ATP-dependent Lon protease